MITYIFATSGIAKVFSWSSNVQYMSIRHLPMIPVLLAIATVIRVGWFGLPDCGIPDPQRCIRHVSYTAVVTALFHNYWAASATMAGIQETHFRKNPAIIGGLLMLAYSGAGK